MAQTEDKVVKLKVLKDSQDFVNNKVVDLNDAAIAETSQYEDYGNGLLLRGNFRVGVYNPVSDSYPGFNHRIGARSPIVYPYDIVLTIKSGFRFLPYRYENNAWVQKGWLPGPTTYSVPANDPFYCQISKNPDDDSVTANVAEWLCGVTVETRFATEFAKVGEFTNNFNGCYYVDNYKQASDTDDTASINRALSAAGAGSIIVFSPNKLYTISSTINIVKPNIKMIALANGMHGTTIKASENMSGWMLNAQHTGFMIHNLTVESNSNRNTYGLQLKRTEGVSDPEDAVHLDAYIYGCYFRNHIQGMAIYGRNAKIVETHFSGCQNGVVIQQISYTKNGETVYPLLRGIIIRDCRFHSIGEYFYTNLSSDDPDAFTNITSITGLKAWCIKNLATNARQCEIDITGNLVDGTNYAGFYDGQPNGVNIIGNTIAGDSKCSVLAYIHGAANGGIDDGIIKGNVASSQRSDDFDTVTYTPTIGNTTPIYILRSSVTIMNNMFANYGGAGVNIAEGKKIKLIDNLFDGICYDGDGTTAIYSTVRSNLNLAITGNTFVRHDGRAGTSRIINSTEGVDTALSKYNSVKNITDNVG